MRVIVCGIGAIGGVIATALAHTGQEVIGIARGARLNAIRRGGLSLRSPEGTIHATFDCVGTAQEVEFRRDDVIVIAVKGQNTIDCLNELREAGVEEQPIFCSQNGVANERAALRFFPNVHGVSVMLPAQYMVPEETVAWASPNYGVFDIGRFPHGSDASDEQLAEALTCARIRGYPQADVMAFKYGKLIMNLGNIVGAVLGRDIASKDLIEHLRVEARSVLRAAGIKWYDVGHDPRRLLMKEGPVSGITRVGDSTSQSLARAVGSVETDFLNGEICLLARLHGIASPANDYATRLGARLARNKTIAGVVSRDELARGMGL